MNKIKDSKQQFVIVVVSNFEQAKVLRNEIRQ